MSSRDLLFIAHGAPSLLTGQSDARAYLQSAGALLDGARALVVISAHWEQSPIGITASAFPQTIHDFQGFGDALARYHWPAQGDGALAEEMAQHLNASGIEAVTDAERGLDHGVWVPLALMAERPAMPVIQVSLPARHALQDETLALGCALASLASDDIQLVFSGAPTHSLRDAIGAREDAPVKAFADRFNSWLSQVLEEGRLDDLADWARHPDAARNHPTPEHLRPLLAAAAGAQGSAERLHQSFTHGALAMDVWRFKTNG